MAAPTAATIYDNIQTAINDILTGQAVKSFTIEGRSVERYSLQELQTLERRYAAKVASAAGSTRSVVRFRRPI